jgi:UrcA family protein
MRIDSSVVQRGLYALVAASSLLVMSVPMSPASAASNAPGVPVHYRIQDLVSDVAAQQLLRRIEVAAHEVCADEGPAPLAIHAAARRCYLAAVARAVDSVNAPRVKAAYLVKYGPVKPTSQARAQRAPAMQALQCG